MALDVSGFDLLNVGGAWRHVSHAARLASAGWTTRAGAERNADIYRGDPAALEVMRRRYVELFPNDAPAA